MKRYGGTESEGEFPLASWIWGHRLRDGQDWIEYLLEFLSVFVGFEHKLGKGIDSSQGYKVPKRLGLRRFVFYDDKEKTKHPLDTLALNHLIKSLRSNVEPHDDESLEKVRVLLRSFSALEKSRSWYAKSLFPAHENLLMWEGLRKGATRKLGMEVAEDTPLGRCDEEISFTQRNFFARGGELYYLFLSAGTTHSPQLRSSIEERLRILLKFPYESLGKVAATVEKSWAAVAGEPTVQTIRLGWIPDADFRLYEHFAEDVNCLLHQEVDALELLYLLAHLICFHVTIHIYCNAHLNATSSAQVPDQRLVGYLPTLPLDFLNGIDGGVIRNVSATQFKLNEHRIEKRAQTYIKEMVEIWSEEPSSDTVSRHLDSRIKTHFRLGSKSQKMLDNVSAAVEAFERHDISRSELTDAYANVVYEGLGDDFRRHFLPVHRSLSKSVGLVSPKTGPNARYTLSDNLLKTLVLCNLDRPITFNDLLERLYRRYGFVVGPEAAKDSGLYEKQHVNIEYYAENQQALLEKLKYAGFATEYSDATAMIGVSATVRESK